MCDPTVTTIHNYRKDEMRMIAQGVFADVEKARLITQPVSDHLDVAWQGSTPERDQFAILLKVHQSCIDAATVTAHGESDRSWMAEPDRIEIDIVPADPNDCKRPR